MLENGNAVASITTDGNGDYAFVNLPAGGRLVRLTVPTGFAATGAVAAAVNVASGATVTADFGLQPQGSIVGIVFTDLNGNTFQEADEPGLANVTLDLVSGGTVQQSITTDVNGHYRFTGITPDSYLLRLVTPAGYVAGSPSEQPIQLAGGAAAGADFALQQQGTIGGVLYHNRNGNHSQESGEPGIAGATVTLHNATDQVTSMQTNAAGRYHFTTLGPGLYQVQVTAPTPWIPQGETQQAVNLGSGAAAVVNFGYQSRGAIAGVVFRDLDGNGSQGYTERGIAGVTIQILQGTTQLTSVVSDADGNYHVSDLVPGNYSVALVLPADFAAVTPLQQAVVLAADGAVNVGFGLQPVSTIAGIVYADRNGDGVRQSSELGVGGTAVTLSTAGPDGTFRTGDEVTIATVQSHADGTYSFLNQPVGAYAVQLTTPTGYTATSPSEVVVNLAQFWTAVANFGNQALNTVAATTFEDRNNNGIQDNEDYPLAGLPVVIDPIVQVQGAAASATYSATTNSAGLALFHGLPAGNYTLQTQNPADGYVARRTLTEITLAPNDVAGEHFGFQPIGTAMGTIFVDSDGNGRQDAGEGGLGGVVVTLRNQGEAAAAARAVLSTTVTTSDGSYRFRQLSAGDYQLDVVPPAGYVATSTSQQSFTLGATGADAARALSVGFSAVGNISGRVFADLNKNGTQERTELGVSGAIVTLRGDSIADRMVRTTVDGTFLLVGLPDGLYRATLALPPEHTATTALEQPVTVAAETPGIVRFGIRPNLPNQAPTLAPLRDIALQRGQSITITLDATDIDDVVLHYSATGLPPGLSINRDTGLISGQAALDSNGRYPVTITVIDPQGASVQRTFTIEVLVPTANDEELEPAVPQLIYLPFVSR